MHIEKFLINIFQMTLCLCTVCFMRGTIPFTHGHLWTVQLNDCAFVFNMHVHSVSCQFSGIGSYNQLSNEHKWFKSEQKRPLSEQTRLFARNVP